MHAPSLPECRPCDIVKNIILGGGITALYAPEIYQIYDLICKSCLHVSVDFAGLRNQLEYIMVPTWCVFFTILCARLVRLRSE